MDSLDASSGWTPLPTFSFQFSVFESDYKIVLKMCFLKPQTHLIYLVWAFHLKLFWIFLQWKIITNLKNPPWKRRDKPKSYAQGGASPLRSVIQGVFYIWHSYGATSSRCNAWGDLYLDSMPPWCSAAQIKCSGWCLATTVTEREREREKGMWMK